MTRRDEIYGFVADILDVPRRNIEPSMKWEPYVDDSLALIELLMAIQEHFEVSFEAQELRRLETVGDLVAAVERKIGAGSEK